MHNPLVLNCLLKLRNIYIITDEKVVISFKICYVHFCQKRKYNLLRINALFYVNKIKNNKNIVFKINVTDVYRNYVFKICVLKSQYHEKLRYLLLF